MPPDSANGLALASVDPSYIAAAEVFSAGDTAWMLMAASLVLLMTPGLAFFYGGMTGRRGVLNMMMMSFGAMAVVGIIYVLWGWSMSYSGNSIGGVFDNPFTAFGLKDQILDADGEYVLAGTYPQIVDIGFQMTFAIISTAIVSGAIAGRVKFSTWLVFTGLWATFSYFPLAHMVWGGGILGEGENSLAAWMFGSSEVDGEIVANIAPIDFAGGTVVHINAGIAALVLALIVGKSRTFDTAAHRPHNLPLVMIGAALLWFGWFGFNGGSSLAADGLAGLAWVNTTVATCAAVLVWLLVERLRDGRATSLGAASGVVAGLVAVTPAAGDLTPVTAIALGGVGGGLACLGVELKRRFNYDDSLDVVGVHLVAGLWGTVGIGLLATDTGLLTGGGVDGFKLLVVQIVIAAFALVFAGVITLIIAMALKKTMGWRISEDQEELGIDTTEHGESAYAPDTRIPAPTLRSAHVAMNEAVTAGKDQS